MDKNKIAFKVINGGITAPSGYSAAGVACGIKKAGGADLALVISETFASAVGMFTTNKISAAPVQVSREHLTKGKAKAIVINSGNANACTGIEGIQTAKDMCNCVSDLLGIEESDVLVSSTGIIGAPLFINKVRDGIREAVRLASPEGGQDAAKAIMTTDTNSKEISVELDISGKKVRIGGMAKGSGMIAPNMATMIAVITTDASIETSLLRKMLKGAVNKSFNCITVDGDMSTNDTIFMLANAQSKVSFKAKSKEIEAFECALNHVCIKLAEAIVRDGEGATKFVTLRINGTANDLDAKRIGLAVANSLLVKCALFGEDANWGRIACAIGGAGVDIDPEGIDVLVGSQLVYSKGSGIAYCAEDMTRIVKERDIDITINMRNGDGYAKILTTDLSNEYVRINAHYKT